MPAVTVEKGSPFGRVSIDWLEEGRKVIVTLSSPHREALGTQEAKREVERYLRAENYQFRGIDTTSITIYPVREDGEPIAEPGEKFAGFAAQYIAYV